MWSQQGKNPISGDCSTESLMRKLEADDYHSFREWVDFIKEICVCV